MAVVDAVGTVSLHVSCGTNSVPALPEVSAPRKAVSLFARRVLNKPPGCEVVETIFKGSGCEGAPISTQELGVRAYFRMLAGECTSDSRVRQRQSSSRFSCRLKSFRPPLGLCRDICR